MRFLQAIVCQKTAFAKANHVLKCSQLKNNENVKYCFISFNFENEVAKIGSNWFLYLNWIGLKLVGLTGMNAARTSLIRRAREY
jgi:hypothetical protein